MGYQLVILALRVAGRDLARLNFEVSKDYGGQNHPWNSTQTLSGQESQEGQPHRVFDLSTDDLAVKKILELVKDDKIQQRYNSQCHRLRKANEKDNGVADEVSDDRE